MGEHAANQKTVNQVTTAWKSKHSLLSRLLCAAPLSSSRLSVPFAWQAKQRPLQLLWDTHLIRGMGLKAWFLLAFRSKTKKKPLFTASQIHDNIRRFLGPRAYHM